MSMLIKGFRHKYQREKMTHQAQKTQKFWLKGTGMANLDESIAWPKKDQGFVMVGESANQEAGIDKLILDDLCVHVLR